MSDYDLDHKDSDDRDSPEVCKEAAEGGPSPRVCYLTVSLLENCPVIRVISPYVIDVQAFADIPSIHTRLFHVAAQEEVIEEVVVSSNSKEIMFDPK